MNANQNINSRYDFLDWLRVIAIFVLIFYHTGMIFVGWDFHIQNAETMDWLKAPMSIAHRLRMPLLFVISGAGLWFAMNTRTAFDVVRERSMRLLLPLVVGMFLIVPPQLYFERVLHNQWQGGYLQFMWERVLQFQPYPSGNFSWHHLWFVVYLYVYVILCLPLLLWWHRRRTPLQSGVWIVLLAVPLCLNEVLLKPIFPETHNLVRDWYLFIHYLLFTLFGFLLASTPNSWDWIAAHRRRIAIGATVMLVTAFLLLKNKIMVQDTAFDSIVANVFTWVTILAFLGYGRARLSFHNRFIMWARDASYPIYILHQTLIITFGFYVIQQSWSPLLKFWVIALATLVSCVALYHLVVKNFNFTRAIFGLKAQRAKARRGPTETIASTVS